MMIYESYAPRRRGKAARLLRFFLFAAILGSAFAAYRYGPQLYYRFLGDSLFRVQNSNRQIGKKIQKREGDLNQLYQKIQENKKVTKILLRNKPASPEILIEQALLDYLELLLGMSLSSKNLIELTGRGFLPALEHLPSREKTLDSTHLALLVAKNLRKALAIEPDLSERPDISVMLIFSDFIYTGRMEPNLLERAGKIEFEKIPPHLRASSEWLLLALYTLSANTKRQSALLDFIQSSEHKLEEDLNISPIEEKLLRCHLLYYTKRYYRAWQIAQRMKKDKSAPLPYRVEAARMVAEVFLIQRGVPTALYYMKEAYELANKEDAFIEERIVQIENKL